MSFKHMMPFVQSLQQTFKRALLKRYILSLDVALQRFWCKILMNGFQIRKVHAKMEYVVVFSSQQVIATTKKIFDEKTFFSHNFLKEFLENQILILKEFFKKNV